MSETIREIIKSKLSNIWNNLRTMTQNELSQELCELSSLLGTLGENIVVFDQALAQKQLDLIDENEEMSCKEVEIRTKITDEYKNFQTAKLLEKAVLETIRSIKTCA